MVSEELLMIERVGIGATAFVLTYLLLRETQRKAFAQADTVMKMAETTIKDNTIALEKMFEGLTQHMKQKDEFIETMKECRRDRDLRLKEIVDNHLN